MGRTARRAGHGGIAEVTTSPPRTSSHRGVAPWPSLSPLSTGIRLLARVHGRHPGLAGRDPVAAWWAQEWAQQHPARTGLVTIRQQPSPRDGTRPQVCDLHKHRRA